MCGILKTVLILSCFLYLCQNFSVILALKCKCDICNKTNNTCETDGYCFTSTYMQGGVPKYSYSCLDKVKFFPPEESLWCHKKATTLEAHICCKESNFCNAEEKYRPLLSSFNNTSSGNCVKPQPVELL